MGSSTVYGVVDDDDYYYIRDFGAGGTFLACDYYWVLDGTDLQRCGPFNGTNTGE